MNEPIVYLNDGFVPASKAKLDIFDLGIVLGATLRRDCGGIALVCAGSVADGRVCLPTIGRDNETRTRGTNSTTKHQSMREKQIDKS